MGEEVDFADAAGKGMAALLWTNCLMVALVRKGIIPRKEALDALNLARKTAAALKPHEVATMAVAALAGLESSWKKQAP